MQHHERSGRVRVRALSLLPLVALVLSPLLVLVLCLLIVLVSLLLTVFELYQLQLW